MDDELSAFDKELESLESSVQRDEERMAVRRRFEQSELWAEHKRYHEEQGGVAKLEIQEAEVKVTQPENPGEQEETHLKTVRFGVCQCQPFNALMQMDDKGDIIAGIPQPVESAAGYTLNASDSTTEYGSSTPGGASGTYINDPSLNKDLYR